MFNQQELSKLSQLKHNIRSSRDIAQGIVRATSGRFGFVTLDDGRDAFLNPEKMERVFPGDRVEIEVKKNKKDQAEAQLEKLLSSPVGDLCGQYRIRGKGHFIAVDSEQFSRWVFIPPKHRLQCKDGDYVSAKVIQHPFKDGRAQAKITQRIGDSSTRHIERLYTLSQRQLSERFPKAVFSEALALVKEPLAFELETSHSKPRQDLRQTPFVTIDTASTRDMDDALAVETSEEGWVLSVAIADPSSEIGFDTPIDKEARSRAQTSYFVDKPVTMLPEPLTTERYSLKPLEDRLSLVFQCQVSRDGHISAFAFIPAIIRSHAKLSYANVAALLDDRTYQVTGNVSDPAEHKILLNDLQACTTVLKQYRQTHHIVMNNKPDFALHLNDQGKLESIEKIERNCAHSIVEEAMLATNRCAGDFLAKHQAGLYTQHNGYRKERRGDIEALLSEKTGTDISQTDQLKSYIHTINMLQSNEQYQPLLLAQQHFLEPSQLSKTPSAHFGLGFNYYATVTSPIRRYQDLYNQRVIHQLLAGKTPNTLNDTQLNEMQLGIKTSRDATRFMSHWLICDYMQSKIGQQFSATISLLTNQGVGVHIDDTSIEGFIVATKAKKGSDAGDKISFNNQRMELLWNDEPIALGQSVSVTLTGIDQDKKKLSFAFCQNTSAEQATA